jgi:hypothetical protein
LLALVDELVEPLPELRTGDSVKNPACNAKRRCSAQ